jgi:hypothetical protein
MKLSQVKAIKAFCAGLFSEPDYREVIGNAGEGDFTVGNVRFIANSAIDEIQQEELASDEYVLGCFNPDFLSGILGVDESIIADIQRADASSALGRWVISAGKLPELQAAYASADGYGHHFNGYDGNEEELDINGTHYHVFDCR